MLSIVSIWYETQDCLAAADCIKVAAMNEGVRLQTWLPEDTRKRFAAIAAHEGLSESAMLRRLVELMLQTASAGSSRTEDEGDVESALPWRFTVRLRVEDYRLLKERAEARLMPASRYASIYLRAHLRNLAPLPKEEYQALKKTTAELGHIGRNLNQLAAAVHRGQGPASVREDLKAFLKVCLSQRHHVNDLLAANVKSWKQGHADAK